MMLIVRIAPTDETLFTTVTDTGPNLGINTLVIGVFLRSKELLGQERKARGRKWTTAKTAVGRGGVAERCRRRRGR